MKALIKSVLLIILLLSLLPINTVSAFPPAPNQFYGYVTLDGVAAPDGTIITASMNGRTAGSTTVSGGQYSMTINTIEGDAVGNAITFYVNGLSAGSTNLNTGSPTQFNLSATSPLPSYTLTIGTSGGGSASGAGTYTAGTSSTNNSFSGLWLGILGVERRYLYHCQYFKPIYHYHNECRLFNHS